MLRLALVHRWTRMLVALVLGVNAGAGWGQNFPAKPVRIVTGEAGGTNDLVSRLIAQGISSGLGQNVVVENRPSSVLGDLASKAPPDGYLLLVAGSTFMLGPLLQKLPYDPVRDFSAITLVISQPVVLVVHPSLPVKSARDLIVLAKAHSGKLNYASTGTGGIFHLAAELLKSMSAVDIVRVPYKGISQAINDTIAGQVQLTFVSLGGADPHIKSGRLRVLAISSARPSVLYPGLSTVAAAGLPGYEAVSLVAAFAPARTPSVLINRLNQEMVRVLSQSEVKEKFLSVGAETIPGSPEQLAATLKSEITKWGKVILDAGIKAE